MIDFESALVYFDCPLLSTRADAHAMYECGACDGDGGMAVYVGTLFSNLAVAGGLCGAFDDGYRNGRQLARHSSRGPYPRGAFWHPGCGRPNTDGKGAP